METASKKKCGRPRIYDDVIYEIWYDKGKRTAQNLIYVSSIVRLMEQQPGGYFVRENGQLRRQSIAEIIGRMHIRDGLPADECRKLCGEAMSLTEHGFSVKDVEKMLRQYRKTLLKPVTDPNRGDWKYTGRCMMR